MASHFYGEPPALVFTGELRVELRVVEPDTDEVLFEHARIVNPGEGASWTYPAEGLRIVVD